MKFKVELEIESESFNSAKKLTEAIQKLFIKGFDWTLVKEIKTTRIESK